MRSGRRPTGAIGGTAAALLLLACGGAGAQDLHALFQRVSPSVAVIHTEERQPTGTGAQEATAAEYTGSGFLISADGKMMTAAHVVQLAEQITVTFPGSEPIKARVIASAPGADVSLLQLDRVPPGATVAPLGDADQMRVGDPIIVVGAPLGVSQTLTYGHISGRRQAHRLVDSLDTGEQELLQTDAAINPGNSGGPMLDMAGAVVGIVSFGLTEAGGATGLNFVVTSNMARRLLLEQKSPWTGMEAYDLTGAVAESLNITQDEGLLVERVVTGSPAARLGLRPGTLKAKIGDDDLLLGGDVLLSVLGVRIGENDWRAKLRAAMAGRTPGSAIGFIVLRSGRQIELRSTDP